MLLRLLDPSCYNDLALLTAVSVIALVIADSRFSHILIRKAAPSDQDYTSVFCFNVGASAVLYFAIVAFAPWIGRYYDQPQFAHAAPIFFLILPLNALGSVQLTQLVRQFRFAQISKITFLASATSGVAAVAMALAGMGLWSIVAQRVLLIGVRTIALWSMATWRPRGGFSKASICEMAPNSLRLMGSDLISALYTKLPQLFIGRIYQGSYSLAYFDQAQKLKDMPVAATVQAVQSVTYPALSRIADDAEKFAESYRKILMVVAYGMFPMMLGMSAVAEDMFAMLGDKWLPTVPYFEAICLVGLFYPLSVISLNVLKVKSDGRIILHVEIIKKVIMTAVFAATIPHSVMAVVWGLVAIAMIEAAVNFAASMRFTTLTLYRAIRTLMPPALLSAAMYGGVVLVGDTLQCGAFGALAAKIAAGVAIYTIGSWIFRLEAFKEVCTLIKRQLAKK